MLVAAILRDLPIAITPKARLPSLQKLLRRLQLGTEIG
jgi:hypothetical protein